MSEIYRDRTRSVEARTEDLLKRMTLPEKVSQLTSVWVYELLSQHSVSTDKAKKKIGEGIGHITRIGGASDATPEKYVEFANDIQRYLVENTRLGIPAIVHEECCSGFMTRGASLFPQTLGVGASWDPEIVHEMGQAIRRQMRRLGAHHALAPVLDVTRDARWGRAEETFGEDPYLVSSLGGSYIEGLQGGDWSERVIATAKHFVGYGMSEGGMNWAPSHIQDRELREVYLAPFEAAVRAFGIASIMNSYGELDGIACGASSQLLRDILRGEWGFEGTVVSDYFAINMLKEYHQIAASKEEAGLLALKAGIDIELPSRDVFAQPLIDAINDGSLEESLVDAACRRLLVSKFKLGLFENPYVEADTSIVLDTESDRTLARELAAKSLVLLKNGAPESVGAGRPLPLDAGSLKKVAVVGPNADSWRNMIGDYAYPCHIETLGNLGQVTNDAMNTAQPEEDIKLSGDFATIITVLDGIKSELGDATEIRYAQGCDILEDDDSNHAEAIEAANGSDVVIAVMGDRSGLVDGCTSGESRDRVDITLPGTQRTLLKRLVATGKPVILVMMNARPVDLSWEAEHVDAILAAWLPGEEGGTAVAETLFGKRAPGGKLPMSFPRHVGQVPVFHGHKPSGGRSHWAGRYVEAETMPLYPFGYGLSYTSFELSAMQLDRNSLSEGDTITVICSVTNTGDRPGDEVVQLYSRGPRNIVTRPIRELRGFKRVSLAPGETKRVSFAVPWDQFRFYDLQMKCAVHPGDVELMLGTSANEIHARDTFTVEAPVDGKEVLPKQRSYFSTVSVESAATVGA